MNFIAGTLGQLVIVELFVCFIWLQVLFETVPVKNNDLVHRKLLFTGIGLVLTSISITGVIIHRIWELITNYWPFVWAVVAFYILMAIGGFMLILAASIGTNKRLLKTFVAVTVVWTAFVFIYT